MYSPLGYIANNNPFRYRGYYYDQETGFYYLNARYYDPQIKRFISPDTFDNLGANGDLNAFNLYAYCSNNPVMYVDPTGEIASWLVILIVIVAIDVTFDDIAQISSGSVNTKVNTNKDGESSVEIENSYEIITPWVQYGYSVYLNYFREDTKDVVDGSSFGMQFEWELHNVAYAFSSVFGLEEYKDQSKHVDLGSTIFEDDHGFLSYVMFAMYLSGGVGIWLPDVITHLN